ncbi:amp dependent CoA ligase [Coprinopsis sp. MPI-PUGE-AT-0042]|nr:amp dependent CoA ligase [Coprinopsis sp. MPI-PUGE-AT-0042]
MSEFRNPVPLPRIPDDLTIPQFMLREISGRPARPSNVPYFIHDATGRAINYEEVHHRTYSLANALSLRWNISRGDVVCIFSPNHVDYAPAIWAAHTLGAIVTPANPAYTADELKYQLETTKAKLIITHPVCLKTASAVANVPIVVLDSLPSGKLPYGAVSMDQLVPFGASRAENYTPVHLKPGEAKKTLAFLSFSSGTTGKPKAVAISHYSVVANLTQMAAHYRINDPQYPHKRLVPGDVAIAVLPFFHIYGLVVTLHFLLFAGLSIVVVPKFSLQEYLKSVVKYRVTHLYVVPPQIVLLCKHPEIKKQDLSHVKYCFSGAAPLGSDLMEQLSKVIPNASICQGYGLTETCTTVCMNPPEIQMGLPGAAGQLLPGITARVIKEDGSFAKEGEQGELVVTGPSMAIGYVNNPKATAETFVNGWVRTGDEVIIKDNQVYVVDRLKEIMKVRGFQVAPAELESHLLQLDYVADACIVPIADEYSGEVPLAYVVLSAEASKRMGSSLAKQEELKRVIQKHVADHKVPYKRLAGGVVFIDAIPKNPSGKMLRRVLRERAKTEAPARQLVARL